MRRCWLYTCSIRPHPLAFCVVFAGFAISLLLAHGGQPDVGPTAVTIGTAVEQQVAMTVDVVGSVEPQLATTLSTEIDRRVHPEL